MLVQQRSAPLLSYLPGEPLPQKSRLTSRRSMGILKEFYESRSPLPASSDGRGFCMRKVIIFGFLLGVLSVVPGRASGGAINDTERAFLLEQLEQSKKAMLASISGLTDAQWTFKPAPSVWSVQECAEHIVLAEGYIFGGAQQILKTPAVDRPEKSNSEVDHILVSRVQDRSQKATAPEPLVPGRRILHSRRSRQGIHRSARQNDCLREIDAGRSADARGARSGGTDGQLSIPPAALLALRPAHGPDPGSRSQRRLSQTLKPVSEFSGT